MSSPIIETDRTSGTGSTLLYIRNESAKQLAVSLSAGQVTLSGSSKTSDTQVYFAAEGDSGPAAPVYEFSLSPSTTVKVRAVVTKAWDSPRLEADLLNGTTRIGKLTVSTPAVNISLQEPKPDQAELNLVDHTPARIILKNDGTGSYDLTFRLMVQGQQVAGHDFHLPPQGTALLEFVPTIPIEWDPRSYVPAILSRIQEVFKTQSHNGDLLLLYEKQGGSVASSSPVKTIPLKTSFNYFSPEWRTTLNYFLIVAILILGGITSLTVGHALPNMLQRLDIDEQLNALARKIANLSSNIDSRLAVLIRLERSRIHDLLKSRTTISPDFTTTVAQSKEGVAKLTTRVSLFQQMDIVIGRLSHLARAGAPPSQIDDIGGSLQQACETLKKVDAPETDIQDAQKCISAGAAGLDGVNRPNPAFGKDLATRVQYVRTNVIPPMANTGTFTRLKTAVPGPFSVIQAVPVGETEIDPSSYASVDAAFCKIQVIRGYVEFAEGTTDREVQARLQQREGLLIGYLNLQTWEDLRSARLLVKEMKEDLYPERLRQVLTANPPEASIHMEPPLAYEEEPLEFSVRFSNSAINTATARDEWCCQWTFGDSLENRGWLASHYFMLPRGRLFKKREKPITFNVTASFQDADGKQVSDPVTQKPVVLTSQILVKPSRLRTLVGERTMAEVARLSVALLIAVFGLVAGVKDQLVKLDVLPGLVAVFLAGYGVDTLKNLMSSSKNP